MSQTLHLTFTDSMAQPAIQMMQRAFPDYSGRTFKIRVANGPINVASYWDGGSRDYFRFVNLADSRVSAEVPAQSAFDRRIPGAEAVTLPDGLGCVQHAIFCGKDMGLTLIIPPSNAAGLLPPKSELTDVEAYVLISTASLKNSYGGQSDCRFRAVNRQFGTTRAEWDAAVEALKGRKLLTGQAAITPDGRNAVADHPLRNCIN